MPTQTIKSFRQTDSQIRNSGIELLKIIAIALIVIFHVTQTLSNNSDLFGFSLTTATTDISTFILILFKYFGSLGNIIFFVCSAWFLLESSKFNKRKWFFMLIEIWVVSVVIMLISLVIRHGNISFKLIIKSLFPTLFSNNWYLTCYLLFYPIHPFLNRIIKKMDKKQLFRASAALFVLYCCIHFIIDSAFFSSELIIWITIYFVMAYIKKYMDTFSISKKGNVIILLIGLLGYIGIAIVTNILGLKISFFREQMLRWANNYNPFLIMIAIALFNFFRNFKFRNRTINYISGLSLLIYIIHENIIFRTYFRPQMWTYVYQKYGHNKIVLWILILSVIVFAFALITSFVYDKTLRRFVRLFSDKLFSIIKTQYLKIESIVLKMR